MENRAHALVAGLFVLLLAAALVVVVAWFRGDHKGKVTYTVVSRLPVAGLNPKAAVKLRGVDVGKVEDVRFDPQDSQNILIAIAVDSDAPIKRDVYAQLGYQGVTGLAYLQLDHDGKSSEPFAVASASATRIELRPSLLDKLSASGPDVLAGLTEVTHRINLMLSDQNLAGLQRTLTNAEVASGRIAVLAERLDPTLKALPMLAKRTEGAVARAGPLISNLDGLAQDLRAQVTSLSTVSAAARQFETSTRSFEQAFVGETIPKLSALMEDLSKTSHAFDRKLDEFVNQPQRVLFGKTPPKPGPGEKGFDARRATQP